MAKPPHGVTQEEWLEARREAARAEIAMLSASSRVGFYPAKIMAAFESGLCDTSGNVAAFLPQDTP